MYIYFEDKNLTRRRNKFSLAFSSSLATSVVLIYYVGFRSLLMLIKILRRHGSDPAAVQGGSIVRRRKRKRFFLQLKCTLIYEYMNVQIFCHNDTVFHSC